MQVAGHFRTVRHADHVLPAPVMPKPLVAPALLDIRVWRNASPQANLPSLLVHAPKRTGPAVARNQFKRRTRMALLLILRENPTLAREPWILWIRPSKGARDGCRATYQDIEGQLRLALLRLATSRLG